MFLQKKILPIFTIFVILLSPVIQEFAFGLAGTTTVLTSSANPVAIGASITFTAVVCCSDATVSPSPPTGLVQFFDGGALLGTAPLVFDAAANTNKAQINGIAGSGPLPAGPHTITAFYSPDANSAYAGSTSAPLLQNIGTPSSDSQTTGQVNVLATCGMQFVSGAPINYGSLAPGTTSAEQTLVLHDTGSTSGALSVSGSNWLDSSAAATNQMNVGNTKFSSTSGAYVLKTPLSTLDQTVGTLSPTLDMSTFWQLQVNLLSSTFAGSLTQTMSFATSC